MGGQILVGDRRAAAAQDHGPAVHRALGEEVAAELEIEQQVTGPGLV